MHDNEHHINTYIAYMSDNYFKFNTFNVEEEMNMKINKLHSHLYGVQELIILNVMDTLFTMKGNHKNWRFKIKYIKRKKNKKKIKWED